MGVWPRKRAKREYQRTRSWPVAKDAKLLGFAGYKVGMTHVSFVDPRKNSLSKGKTVRWPVTILECPPLKVHSIRFYKKKTYGLACIREIVAKTDRDLERKLPKSKDGSAELPQDASDYDDIRILAYTQPRLTGIGKKKPEVFEIAIGGSGDDKLKFARDKLGKEIPIEDVFADGSQVDMKAITKGKGFQGPVKRFGVTIRSHKAEKTKRGPANVGAWGMKGKRSWTVPHAGQMGYHSRTDYNKILLKISGKAEEVNKQGGFIRYGVVRNTYVLVKGSVPGPTKRLIRFNRPVRPNKKLEYGAMDISSISLKSNQGN